MINKYENIMKTIKQIGIAIILAVLLCPVAAYATNDYYRDSYSMWRFADDSPSGSLCTGVTEHNERFSNATAGIFDQNGVGITSTKGPAVTARVSKRVNRYNHTHSIADAK